MENSNKERAAVEEQVLKLLTGFTLHEANQILRNTEKRLDYVSRVEKMNDEFYDRVAQRKVD